MRGYPQFSFWILVTLAEICVFHIVHKPRKNVVVLGSKFIKKPEHPEMRRTHAQ